MKQDMILARVDKARMLLAQAKDAVGAKQVVDMAHAAEIYAKRQKFSQESIDYAHAVKVDAMTLMGDFLYRQPKNKGVAAKAGPGRGKPGTKSEPGLNGIATLADLGIGKKESSVCQKLAVMIREKPERHAAIRAREVPISAALGGAHVGHNSGNNEWYTPGKIIEMAKRVIGGDFDLDPASSKEANEVVGAKKYFSVKDDGLKHFWVGRVWMNPPYAGELIGKFCAKLAAGVEDGDITEAFVLVNNATETGWFQGLARCVKGVRICFPSARVRFWSPGGDSAAPLQGQAILYFGKNGDKFAGEFFKLGMVCDVLC